MARKSKDDLVFITPDGEVPELTAEHFAHFRPTAEVLPELVEKAQDARDLAVVHKDADSNFGVSFPALPGCVSAGATMEEAVDNAAKALGLHLHGMAEDGEEPVAFDVNEVTAKAHAENAVIVLIESYPPPTNE